jgi:PmbA protein
MTNLAEQLLELSLQSGADFAEVYQSKSLANPVFFEANRLKQLESAESEGTALRLWKNGQSGIAVAYGEVDAQSLVDKAIAISALNPIQEVNLVANREQIYPDLGSSMEVENLVKIGKETISLIRDSYPEVLCSAQLDCDQESIRLVNSEGLNLSYTDTTLSFYLGLEWVRGDDFLSVSGGQTQRGILQPDLVVKEILQRLQWAEKNVTSPTAKIPVLFTNKATDLLWDIVQAALNGKRVIETASPWSDRQGKQVISPLITLTQKPNFGPYSCPFDDEGLPTQDLTLIDGGILQQFYSDRATAKLLNLAPTGNGFKPGLGSYPTPELVNLIVNSGADNLSDLIAQIDEGIIIDQVLGGSSGISGDFSVNIDLGFYVKKGEILGRVKDTMISGNVYNVLKEVIALGADNDWNGGIFTPSLIVDGISVTGKKE